MIRHFTRVVCALVALLALSVTGHGAPWFEDFDSYATGSPLHGQGGWKGWDNAPGASAPTSNSVSLSSPNSVQIDAGADLVHEYSAVGGRWFYRAMQYIPSTSAGESYFILLNDYNDGSPYDWSVQTRFDMNTGLVIADFGGGATLPLVTDRWVELLFDIDLGANTVSEYYDGLLLSTHVWDDDATNALAAVDLFANGAQPVFYDDMGLFTPEPATLSLLALGGLGLLRRRRRKA